MDPEKATTQRGARSEHRSERARKFKVPGSKFKEKKAVSSTLNLEL
jgi:hypothetical protein